jgi:hypothetical protein
LTNAFAKYCEKNSLDFFSRIPPSSDFI